MSVDALREQIRAQLRSVLGGRQTGVDVPPVAGRPGGAVVVPLRVVTAGHAQALLQLIQRLAASPALLQAVRSGMLRFDLRVDQPTLGHAVAPGGSASAMAATTAIDPAACCSSCREGKACECRGDTCDLDQHQGAQVVPQLKGVIGEKLLKSLPLHVKAVRLHPKAVVTPLGKETLRKRGITITRGDQP